MTQRQMKAKKILEEATSMYVDKCMSINDVVSTIRDRGDSITVWKFLAELKSAGVNRSSTETYVRQRVLGLISNRCTIKGCTRSCRGRRKFCDVCIPDGIAHITFLRRGITHPQVLKLLNEQGNVCAGCQKEMKRGTGKSSADRLCVDHDHATERVRGILCHACNTALGYVKDDPETLRRLALYVEKHQSLAERSIEGEIEPAFRQV